MGDELISVIIPVYKTEDYLAQCLETVLGQTYRNIEVILVDDGSPDRCPELCDDYAALDARVRVIHKANGGISDARNAGLDAAKGELIAFVDSDDWVDYDFLEVLHGALEACDADIAACGIVKAYDGRYKRRCFFESSKVIDGAEAMREILLNVRMSSHTWNKLYRRRLFDGLRFPVGRNYEDIYIMHRIFAGARRVAAVSDWKYYYRQHSGSIIYTPSIHNLLNRFEAYRQRYEDAKDSYRDLRTQLIRMAVDAALDLMDSKAGEGEERAGARRSAEEFLREVSRSRRDLKSLGAHLTMRVRHPRFDRRAVSMLQRLVKPVAMLYRGKPRRMPIPQPDWRALGAEDACVLLGSPEYGNLGDSAIGYAEKKFFEDGGRALAEVTECQCHRYAGRLARTIRPGALIALQGGGNLGSQYRDQEAIRAWAIRKFPKNRMVLFPQTLHFPEEPGGEKEKKSLAALYGAHRRLTLFAREAHSFALMRGLFSNPVELAPDIVMSLPAREIQAERMGALLILRSDVEARLDATQFFAIKNELARQGHQVEFADTLFSHDISLASREQVLDGMLRRIASAKLVVTDRLHAMIFSAIAGTPCVAFGNYNHKLPGCYEWLKPLGYISFCERVEAFDAALGHLDLEKAHTYRSLDLSGAFEGLRKAIEK